MSKYLIPILLLLTATGYAEEPAPAQCAEADKTWQNQECEADTHSSPDQIRRCKRAGETRQRCRAAEATCQGARKVVASRACGMAQRPGPDGTREPPSTSFDRRRCDDAAAIVKRCVDAGR